MPLGPYGTSVIPHDEITVFAGSTVAISIAFENSLGLVGGMDTINGNATPGEVTRVTSPSDAAQKFGDGSELHEQIKLAFGNGVGTIYALPVDETGMQGETHSSQSGTLSNAPVFDPRVNDEHEITVTDSGGNTLDVNVVDEPPTEPPSETDTVDVYPPTGAYHADAAPSGSNYEFDYSYGDYSLDAVEPLIDESPRIIALCTENESVVSDVTAEANNRARSYDFMHVIGGTQVAVDPSSYSPSLDQPRASLVQTARGYTDTSRTNEVRTVGAIGGYLASLPLGLSSTNDSISGLAHLKNEVLGPPEAGELVDAGVMPLLDYGGDEGIKIVKDMTTSSEPKFERVYGMQVIDEAVEVSHSISRNFVGEQNTDAARQNLRREHRNAYLSMTGSEPQLLSDFTLSVSQNDTDPYQTDVTIGLQVVPMMDYVSVDITVGDIVRGNEVS